jgi:hypothetical protein
MNVGSWIVALATISSTALVMLWVFRADDADRSARTSPCSRAVEKNPPPSDDPKRALQEAVEAGERQAAKEGKKGSVLSFRATTP